MNKTVLITGGAGGIGSATAKKFAKQGYDIAINYYSSDDKAIELKNSILSEYQVKAEIYKADVSDESQVSDMIDRIKNDFGKVDVLVNNAGIVYDRDFEDITIEQFKKTLSVNVIGAFIVAREIRKIMPDGGAIVNVSSTNGTKTISPECLDYNISKIGLQSLTRDLAFQFRPSIRVNAVAIGWANTDMNKDLPDDYIKTELEKIYLGRFAKPEEIANAIYFLASDEASYVNGSILTIDAGY
ncbi:SDR family oxidoreductase [Candidatus Saccharibacteria bacterium]|nr:SDR family oxidoreductase [Candidatus Saccharibacteria bacterium]